MLSLYLHVSSVAYGFLASYGAAHLKHSLQSLELDSARRKLNGLLGLVIESVTRAVVAV